jgi:site-specific DNA-methyltransferase (adenine-specific)
MGSGTTAIACMNTNRNFLGFELDENYHKIACERVAEWYNGKTTL